MARDLLMAVIIGGVVGGVLLAAKIKPADAGLFSLVTFLIALAGLTMSRM